MIPQSSSVSIDDLFVDEVPPPTVPNPPIAPDKALRALFFSREIVAPLRDRAGWLIAGALVLAGVGAVLALRRRG